MARVLGRIRLSLVTDESTSVTRQKDHITKWATENGHTVVAWVVDENFSRSVDPMTAPKLKPWLTDPEKIGTWDLMAAWRVDRLGAGWKLSKLFTWIMENGKDLACTDMPFNLRSEYGWMAFTMYAQSAQSEWNAIQARALSSQAHLRKIGRWRGGSPAYWLQAVQKSKDEGWTLVLDSYSANVTEGIIREYLDRRPIEAICRRLNDDPEILAPSDYRRQRTGKEVRGTRWLQGTINDILKNPMLMGHSTHEDRVVLDSEGSPVLAAEPLISPARFEQIQAETARRKSAKAPRRESGAGPLLGVLFCGECSGPAYLNVQTNRRSDGDRVYRYYRFPCGHWGRISAEDVESKAEESFLAVLGGFPRMEPVYIPAEDHTVELDQAQSAVEELSGLMAGAKSSGARERLSGQIRALDARIAELELRPRVEARTEYRETGETYRQAWARMDWNERRTLMTDAGFQMVRKEEDGHRVISARISTRGIAGLMHWPEPTIKLPAGTRIDIFTQRKEGNGS